MNYNYNQDKMLIDKIYPAIYRLPYILYRQKYPSFNSKIESHKNLYKFSVQNYMKTYASDQITRTHGRMRVDENAKLYSESKQIQRFISQQNVLYEKQSQKWKQRTQQYVNRVNQRRDERSHSIGQIYNGYEYYTTVNWYEGRQYTQIYRKSLKNNKKQLVLDIMKYPSIRKYCKTVELTRTVFSNDNKYIAFGIDLKNNQEISFMIKNIVDDHIVGIKGWENNKLQGVDNLVFGGQNGIFYTKVVNYRPSELWYQNINSGETQLLYTQKNGEFYLDISMAKDGKHLIVNSNSKQHSKIWMINTQKAPSKLSQNNKQIQGKLKEPLKKYYQLEQLKLQEQQTKIYINHNGSNFVVWKNGIQANQIILLNQNNLQKHIPIYKLSQDSYETITDIDIFQNYIVLYIRKIVSPVIRVLQLEGQKLKNISQIDIPYQIGTVHPGANQMLKCSSFLFYINNIFVYNEGYEYDFKTKKTVLKQQFKMTGPKFNPNDYIVNLHEVATEDGQLVPLTTIVAKKNAKNRNKMLLHCYGHYGLSYDINFNNVYWAALQNGWSLAYAHVRGGNEKGNSWHKLAVKQHKYKNWHDLQDCVAYLLKHQYTHPNILVLSSHSAGSITIWNTINRYPHLYKAVIMSYPFLDVLGSLLDNTKPLSESDYAEFGNPNDSLKTYNCIQSYSPYENIHQNTKYPFIYMIAGKNDYRCPIDQIGKFAKRFRQLRRQNSNSNINDENYNSIQRVQNIGQKGLLIKINQGSHEGIADLNEQIKDGCQALACMDYVIEEASKDVMIVK